MKQYHVSVDGQQPSLVAEDVLAKEAAEGRYPENTLIWCEGMAGWEPLGKHFKSSFSCQLDGGIAKVPLDKLKSLKTRLSAGGQGLKLPLPLRAKKLLLILGGVGLCLIILFSIVSISGQSRQNQLAVAYSEMVTCIGEDDWGQLYQKFSDKLADEHYVNLYYADGTSREKTLYEDEDKLYYRAFRQIRVSPKRVPLAGEENLHTRFDIYDIYDLKRQLRAAERQLGNSDPDRASQIQELMQRRDALKKELCIRCALEDESWTRFLISFLANGEVNTTLAEAINQAFELRNTNLEDQDVVFLVHQLTQLYGCQRKISAEIPAKAQLFIVDEYERYYLSREDSFAKQCGYQSPEKLVALRKQLRKAIRKSLKKRKQS